MSSVFKPAGSKKWVIVYVDEAGRRRKVTGTTDKRVTDMMARDLDNAAELRRRGLIDPRAEALRDHGARPLAAHLVDWRAHLIAKGGTVRHADQSRTRAARIVALVKGATLGSIDVPPSAKGRKREADELVDQVLSAARLADLEADRVQSALDSLRKAGRSPGCVNGHLRAVKGFSRWLWRIARRTSEDTLAGLSLVNEEVDRRHVRRELGAGEIARVIEAAEIGPRVEGMDGPERAVLYRVAVGTGFRANEPRSLTPESFRLHGASPSIVVPAAYSKRRREDVQPIRPELAATLRPWLATKAPGVPVFATMPTHRTAAMLRADLEAAGLPYRDGSGRVADFHSLRAAYISAIVRGGASVKTAQTLARHSSPTLTIARYAQSAPHDQTAALAGLPVV